MWCHDHSALWAVAGFAFSRTTGGTGVVPFILWAIGVPTASACRCTIWVTGCPSSAKKWKLHKGNSSDSSRMASKVKRLRRKKLSLWINSV